MDVFTKLKNPSWWREQYLTNLYAICRSLLCTIEDRTPGYKDLYKPTHKKICTFVEQNALPGHELLILCPRGWLKSYIITCGWLLQRILRNLVKGTREIWLLANAIEANAIELLWRIKYNFQFNEELRELFEEYIPKDPENQADRWTMKNIELSGNRIEVGAVEKALESRHYGGGAINDDLVCWANSRTKDQLLKTIEWWRTERPLLLPWSTKINIGTRWDEDDLYGWMLSKFLRLTRAQFEELKTKPFFELHRDKFHFLYFSCFKDPVRQRGSTFPNMYPEKELKRIMAEMGDLAGGQLLNDPLSMSRGRIKPSWFEYWKEHGVPEEGGLPLIRTTLMTCDWAGVDKNKSDYSAISVVDAGCDKKLYVRLAERKLVTDRALAEWIIDVAVKFYPAVIGIEEGKFRSIQETLEMLVPQIIREGRVPEEHIEYAQKIPYLCVELKHHGRPKPHRIDLLCSWIETHRMLFAPYGMDDVKDELLRFPRSTRDDIADALAYILDLLAQVGFPTRADPVKYLVVPEELKMSPREREERDWEQYQKDVGLQSPGFDEEDYL